MASHTSQPASASATRSLLSDKPAPTTTPSASTQSTSPLPAPPSTTSTGPAATTQTLRPSHPTSLDQVPTLQGQGKATDNYAQAQAQAAAIAGSDGQTQPPTNCTMREKKREVVEQFLASREPEVGKGYSTTTGQS